MLVELHEIRLHFLIVVCLPELEVCATLQELTHTLRFADTRHLNHDAAFLSFELLDVRLNYSELVDTVAHNVERVVDGRLHFLAQHLLNFTVRALSAYLALKLLCCKHCREASAVGVLLVGVDEKGYKVALTCLFLLTRLL